MKDVDVHTHLNTTHLFIERVDAQRVGSVR
jgi:hypothetical protein